MVAVVAALRFLPAKHLLSDRVYLIGQSRAALREMILDGAKFGDVPAQARAKQWTM
jgi:hypothetical protein